MTISSSASINPVISHFSAARGRGLPDTGLLFVVDVGTQTMTIVDRNGVGKRFVVSTATAGVGNVQDSFRTPLGWHRIAERIGENEPPGRVFKARVPQARRLRPEECRSPVDGDLVLTRILWLRGLEPGYNSGGNVDTYRRTIYLHGTDQEQLLGQPASHGCIRLSNRDILEVFELTENRETWCLILRDL